MNKVPTLNDTFVLFYLDYSSIGIAHNWENQL